MDANSVVHQTNALNQATHAEVRSAMKLGMKKEAFSTREQNLCINNLNTVIPSVIFPPLSFSPPSKKFLKKIFVRCHFPPPEFKHIMFKNDVFCYIILIKLNKIFKIIFQKIFCWPLSFSPLTKICKIVTFWGENDKGYYGSFEKLFIQPFCYYLKLNILLELI